MSEPPDPLTPRDCDLRDFPFMPLDIMRLRRSRSWLLAKRDPAIAFYLINLWTASWHEVPAGSLEDDDLVLSDLAMCDAATWERVRETALRGWIKCTDGRLYHPVVCEKATEAWERKQRQREKGRRGNLARWGRADSGDSVAPPPSAAPSDSPPDRTRIAQGSHKDRPGIAEGSPKDRKGQGQGEGERQGEKKKDPSPSGIPPTTDPASPAAPAPAGRENGETEEPSAHGSKGPRAPDFEREDGPSNPRAAGTNPRAVGTNPRVAGSRLPPQWAPTAADRAFAAGLGLDPDAISASFGDYWRAQPGQRGRKADWAATWRNWCRRDAERPGPRAAPARHDGFAVLAAELRAAEQARDRSQSAPPLTLDFAP